MSGIYIHIPFCKKACHYCNFHFSTNVSRQDQMVAAICKDIALRHNYLDGDEIESVYFGGGTPSLLTKANLTSIFHTLANHFKISSNAEITLECNPDDLSIQYLETLKTCGINRLSIGIQSFFEDDLVFMNRAHSAAEAEAAIGLSKEMGFDNITIDLIYGSPTTTMERWQSNVQKALAYGIPHISAYCLTIEEKTVFDHWVKTDKMKAPEDSMANDQFEYLIDTLTQNGYDHYEISNFGKPHKYAVHNSNYWRGKKYLGIGPSAHSYNGLERSWCIANNALYISALDTGASYIEKEDLSQTDKYNEYIMIGLRTMWGIDPGFIKENFGPTFYSHLLSSLKSEWLQDKVIVEINESAGSQSKVTLSRQGKFFADRIAAELFM